MTDTIKLEDKIAASGLKKNYIAEQMGITRFTLHNKVTGKTEFNATEIKSLCNVLGIEDLREREDIFFS